MQWYIPRNTVEQPVVNGRMYPVPRSRTQLPAYTRTSRSCGVHPGYEARSSRAFTWLIRFRAQTTTWSRERSIQPALSGCFTVKRAAGVGEVGFTCSNRRWPLTNSSSIAMRQVCHSASGTHPDPLSGLRWGRCKGGNSPPLKRCTSNRAIYHYHAAWAHDPKTKLDQCEMGVSRCALCTFCLDIDPPPSWTITATFTGIRVCW